MPSGRSILRLRESLGETGEGPDLAAFARSPILRELSRCVRRPGPGGASQEVKRWAKSALVVSRSNGERDGSPGREAA